MKALKFAALFVLLISCNYLSSQVYWVNQQSPVTAWLYRCVFTDTLNGWVCGDSGTVVHTTNGGVNWVQQTTNVDYFVEDICFTSKFNGWGIANDFVFYKSYIMRTTDGGENWNLSPYPDSTIILDAVYFLDSLNGYMGGFNGVILKTTNGGSNWNIMPVDSSLYYMFHIKSFRFFNSRIGVACGGIMDFGGIIWKTTDYGYHWKAFIIAPEPIYDVRYLDSNIAYATGGDFEYGASFEQTADNWDNHNYLALGFFGVGQAIAMRTPNEIWIPLGFSLAWAVSTDNAQTWSMVVNPDSNGVYDAVFVDSTHGWAAGSNGRIYKFNQEIIGVNNHGNTTLFAFRLFQNYPNPFNPATKIKYQIPDVNGSTGKTSRIAVQLVIYDVLGKRVNILVDENKNPGTYEIEWDASGLPSGVYFYKLSAGSFTQTKKMVLLK
jgi:photosystem II stability/assembly factor-like uncharacterized protein